MNYFGFEDYSYQGSAVGNDVYVNITPPAPLNRWVQCFWLLKAPPGRHVFRGVPGNNIDCIFLAPGAERYSSAVMPLSKPALFEMDGPIKLFGIRLRVLAQHWLMPTPIGEWQGDGLQSLFGERMFHQLMDLIDRDLPFESLCALVGDVLLQAFLTNSASAEQIDPRVLRFLNYAHQNHGSALDLNARQCSDLAVSSRHLRRLCNLYLGLNPRDFYRVIRFQRMLHHMRLNPSGTLWDDLYYDQSHFIREFKAHSGLTPQQFSNSSVLYNTDQFQRPSL